MTLRGGYTMGPVAIATGPCRASSCGLVSRLLRPHRRPTPPVATRPWPARRRHPPIIWIARVAAFVATLPPRGEQEDAFQNHPHTHHMW